MNIRTYLRGLSRQEKQWRREGSKISTRLSLLPVFHQNYLRWKPRHPRRAERRRKKSYKSQLMQNLMAKYRIVVYTQLMQNSVGEINKGTTMMIQGLLHRSLVSVIHSPDLMLMDFVYLILRLFFISFCLIMNFYKPEMLVKSHLLKATGRHNLF